MTKLEERYSKKLINFLKREQKALSKYQNKTEYVKGYEHGILNVIDKLPMRFFK